MCHIFVIACLYSRPRNALLYRFLHLRWGRGAWGWMVMGQEGEKHRVFRSKADCLCEKQAVIPQNSLPFP